MYWDDVVALKLRRDNIIEEREKEEKKREREMEAKKRAREMAGMRYG